MSLEGARGIEGGRGWALALGVMFVVLLLVLLPPFLGVRMRWLLYGAFSPLCHQIPERMLYVNGAALAVCSRCLGIYFGLVAGTLSYPFLRSFDERPGRSAGLLLALAVAIPGADWVGGLAGFWSSGHVVRAATGLVFGLVSGYYLAKAAAGVARRRVAGAV